MKEVFTRSDLSGDVCKRPVVVRISDYPVKGKALVAEIDYSEVKGLFPTARVQAKRGRKPGFKKALDKKEIN